MLERVDRDGAYAAAALDTELDRQSQLDARDRALATEIVYGVLRTRAALVGLLTELAPRGLPVDPLVLAHLLVAAYQILLLDRVPKHAAVDGAVSGIKIARGPKVAGFANAVLRKLASGDRSIAAEAAIVGSAARWLLAGLERAVGPEEARALLGARSEAAPLETRSSVRVISGRPVPDWLAAADRGRASPVARLVPRSGDLRRRDGHADGAFVLQEEGAQVVALALGARPGERVLDACAGRGQKTTLLRERIGAGALLWATDLYPEKLQALGAEFARLGLEPPVTAAVDWSVGVGVVPGEFDRVLVDAPCTGTGTLRRRPEIGLRLLPGDPARLGALSATILRRAASRAKRGGRIVFAVCSVLEEECEAVVAGVEDVLEPVPFDAPELSAVIAADVTSLRLLPLRHGTDGFFIASLRRR